MVSPSVQPLLLRALGGETLERPPIWFMRQAGRTLPEYRALREKAPDFIGFCLNPEMAAEATLQPMRRFPFSAAIVFADILLLPRALGQDVWFETGEGPKLGALPSIEALAGEVAASTGRMAAVGETLKLVRAKLEPERALIGFAGAPWTVATYMLERGSSDRQGARSYAYTNAADLDRLIDVLIDATILYLAMQARSGAQVLKIFESWAENLPQDLFDRLVIGPHARIVKGLRNLSVTVPVIGFPRGAPGLVERYAALAGTDAVALDVGVSAEAGQRIQQTKTIQGSLDPLLLRAGDDALDARVDQLLEQWSNGPYVFNLGHGLLPDTPIAHIERVVRRVTGQ